MVGSLQPESIGNWIDMLDKIRTIFVLLFAIFAGGGAYGVASTATEARVLDYVRTHLQPGQSLMVTDLYNRVFTQPDERKP